MLTHFEEITGNNVQLNTGFYEKSVFVCVYAHVCATALWLHVLLPSTLGLYYLVQYFNHLLAKQWNKPRRVTSLFAMKLIV